MDAEESAGIPIVKALPRDVSQVLGNHHRLAHTRDSADGKNLIRMNA